MRKTIITTIATVVIGLTAATSTVEAKGVKKYSADEIYSRVGIIYALDYETDIVYFSDACGMAWSFYGTEDYEIGDYVACVMYDNGTPTIYDDIIINARYCGYSAEG